MSILRLPATHSQRMQKIGTSDLFEILCIAKATSPVQSGKIKMGGTSLSFGSRGRQTCLGCEFWRIRRALCRLLGKSDLTYLIVLCGLSVHLSSLPICQIWSKAFNFFSRYGGVNLRKLSFDVTQALYWLYDVCKKLAGQDCLIFRKILGVSPFH